MNARTVDARVADILARLSLPEKAGLLFHTVVEVGDDGALINGTGPFGTDTYDLVVRKGIRHVNVTSIPDATAFARWHNELQRLALSSGSGLPMVVTANPSHSIRHNSGSSLNVSAFSQWPEPLGLAALGDEETVRAHARAVKSDLLSVGIRGTLSPNLDLATDPRWARLSETWGDDPQRVARFAGIFINELQGPALGRTSIFCMAKHFPGGGAQVDGEDPHFAYGAEQEFTDGSFPDHLLPFRAAIGAGVAAIMPGYGKPVDLVVGGRSIPPVGFGFNRELISGVLRNELGFDGLVCTDWGIVSDVTYGAEVFPAKAWGLEAATSAERLLAIFDAGCDQVGGEDCADLLVDLVVAGKISPARLDESVTRVLRVMVSLELLDDPFVDVDAVAAAVGRPEDLDAGELAQSRAITVLSRRPEGLADFARSRVFAPLLDQVVLAEFCIPVDRASDADLAIVRLGTPFDAREGSFLENRYHSGSLEFDDETLIGLRTLAETLPLIIDVDVERGAAVTPLVEIAAILLASFGASDRALLNAISGRCTPVGRLPTALPVDDAAISMGAGLRLPDAAAAFPKGHQAVMVTTLRTSR